MQAHGALEGPGKLAAAQARQGHQGPAAGRGGLGVDVEQEWQQAAFVEVAIARRVDAPPLGHRGPVAGDPALVIAQEGPGGEEQGPAQGFLVDLGDTMAAIVEDAYRDGETQVAEQAQLGEIPVPPVAMDRALGEDPRGFGID